MQVNNISGLSLQAANTNKSFVSKVNSIGLSANEVDSDKFVSNQKSKNVSFASAKVAAEAGGALAGLIGLFLVTNPIGLIALGIGASLLAGKASNDAANDE